LQTKDSYDRLSSFEAGPQAAGADLYSSLATERPADRDAPHRNGTGDAGVAAADDGFDGEGGYLDIGAPQDAPPLYLDVSQ